MICLVVKLECILAHLSRRLTGELLVYLPINIFQTPSSLKPLVLLNPNFMWRLLRVGKGSLQNVLGHNVQDGRQAHI